MRQLMKQVLSYFPTKIPVGMTEFNKWLDSIVELAGPIADTDSLQWVISNEVMRLSSTRDRVAKAYFVRTLRKYAANQLAAATVMEIKRKQEEKQLEAKKAQEAANKETTASVETSKEV